MNHIIYSGLLKITLLILVSISLTTSSFANHQWGRYLWVQDSLPITLPLFYNLSTEWKGHLDDAKFDWVTPRDGWTKASVLDLNYPVGAAVSNCEAINGSVLVCNANYGENGWLGIAQIWIQKGKQITKASTKLNDYYFSLNGYNSDYWRQLVMCQEIGHAFALDHQDEDFDNENLGTCMDYTSDPFDNTHPNYHDYEQLEAIYGIVDEGSVCNAPPNKGCNKNLASPSAMDNIGFNGPTQWGRSIRRSSNGHQEVFELDFGHGHKVITFVIWADVK